MSHSDSFDDSEKGMGTVQHLERIDSDKIDDDAVKVLALHQVEAPITEAESRAVCRKIDWMLMPIMGFTVFLQATDKGIFGTGAVFGMATDTGLFFNETINGKVVVNTGRYSLATMIFYVGYICGSYPLALLAQKFPVAKMAALYTALWAIVLICMPAVSSYPGAMLQRFFLGVMEGGVSPAYTIITAMWYTKSEQAFRLPLWYCGGFSGLSISYLINFGLMHVESDKLAKWQILFIFWGALTFCFSFVAFIFLPDSPVTWKGFTERERYVAIERLRTNQDTIRNTHIKWDHVKEAFMDIKVWLIALMVYTTIVPNGLASTFLPTIVKSIGFNSYQSLLLSMPSSIIGAVYGLVGGYIGSKKKGARSYIIMIGMLPCVVGAAILWKVPRTNAAASLAGLYLASPFSGVFSLALSLAPSSIAGSTKRTVGSALVFVFFCLGNITGPLVFEPTQAPIYNDGFLAYTVCVAASIVITAIYRFVCARENKRRDALGEEARVDHAFHDLTDKQNLSFRYAL